MFTTQFWVQFFQVDCCCQNLTLTHFMAQGFEHELPGEQFFFEIISTKSILLSIFL